MTLTPVARRFLHSFTLHPRRVGFVERTILWGVSVGTTTRLFSCTLLKVDLHKLDSCTAFLPPLCPPAPGKLGLCQAAALSPCDSASPPFPAHPGPAGPKPHGSSPPQKRLLPTVFLANTDLMLETLKEVAGVFQDRGKLTVLVASKPHNSPGHPGSAARPRKQQRRKKTKR